MSDTFELTILTGEDVSTIAEWPAHEQTATPETTIDELRTRVAAAADVHPCQILLLRNGRPLSALTESLADNMVAVGGTKIHAAIQRDRLQLTVNVRDGPAVDAAVTRTYTHETTGETLLRNAGFKICVALELAHDEYELVSGRVTGEEGSEDCVRVTCEQALPDDVTEDDITVAGAGLTIGSSVDLVRRE